MADTTHLTLEEHGAYLLLLMAMWRRAGAIAEADAARVLGLHARAWLRLKPRLMPMLISYQSEGVEMLSQKKLQIEWNYSVENRRRQSEKGRAVLRPEKGTRLNEIKYLAQARAYAQAEAGVQPKLMHPYPIRKKRGRRQLVQV
jgi:uncharacterized protein YdaU (DUF1376 family)